VDLVNSYIFKADNQHRYLSNFVDHYHLYIYDTIDPCSTGDELAAASHC